MIESISRPRLAEGRSYVLKTSELAEALASAGIECPVTLVYWSPQSGGSLLEGHYWLPNEIVSHPRIYIRAGSVPSHVRAAAAESLRTEGLSRLIRWAQSILALPDDSPALSRESYFNFTFSEHGAAVARRPVFKVRKRVK